MPDRDPLACFRIRRFEIKSDRPLGDSQVRSERFSLASLELTDGGGRTGLGFCATLLETLPPAAWLSDTFRETLWPVLRGELPEALVHRVARPRGGNVRRAPNNLDGAISWALWDLAAQRADIPLWRMLGGVEGCVRAYGSGLCFHLDESSLSRMYGDMAAQGFSAYKVKVGHPDVEWDLRRLSIVREAVGRVAQVSVDANEAWSVAEAAARLSAYKAAGHSVHWVEDPILRSDCTGLVRLRGALSGALVNSGEYVDADAKMTLLQAGAVDILNLNDAPGDALRLGYAAAARGLPVTVGNTNMNLGANVAAALPEVDRVEESFLGWTAILAEPYPNQGGSIVLPNVPGHGLSLHVEAHRWEVSA